MASRNVKIPADRHQVSLLPPSLEEYVATNNPVRAIDCYVENVDLERLGFRYASGGLSAGQPAYHPKELAKLYIYGYLHKSRSSRHLANDACKNLELMWLLGNLQPSHATIANFRKDNASALVALNKDFLLLCKDMNLFGGNSVAIDGAFFRGNASKDSITTQKQLTQQIERLEDSIKEWQGILDERDRDDNASHGLLNDKEDLSAKLAALKDRLDEKNSLNQQLKESDETQVSTTDPDARLLSKRGETVSGYNVQIAVDDKHKLLAATAVTNDGNDSHQLAPMSLQAKDNLGSDELNSYADAGYNESNQFKTCEDAGVTPYVPLPNRTKPLKDSGRYSREDFVYDEENNTYTCPNNVIMTCAAGLILKREKYYYRFFTKVSNCKDCPLKASCLTAKSKYRIIHRWEHEKVLERHKQRMRENPDAMKKRMGLAEHPFGTLKRRAGLDHFLVRGFKGVRGEWSLMAMCYNWTRALNVLGMETFMEACANRTVSG